MNKVRTIIINIKDFLEKDLWEKHLSYLPRKQAFVLKQLRIILMAIRGIKKDNCLLRASSLTFYSVLSIVPVVAMAFGIAQGFGFEKHLETQLLENFVAQEEAILKVIAFARSLLENTQGEMIAGMGILFLIWSIMKVMGNIENSFNAIWEVKHSRTLTRKFSDYISIMLISPVLILLASSATVFITTEITSVTQEVQLLGFFSPLIFIVLKLLPYGLIWIWFIFLNILMPNTRVNFSAGLIAGILAGTIFQMLQWSYINFQVGISRYNAIYGSFAALPLFLIWLQLSWLIVLFSAQISFAFQNVNSFSQFNSKQQRISYRYRQLLWLEVTHLVIKIFENRVDALTSNQISQKLNKPFHLTDKIINELVESRILSKIMMNENDTPRYQPALDINKLTIKYILDALEKNGNNSTYFAKNESSKILLKTLDSFDEIIDKSSANRLLKDI